MHYSYAEVCYEKTETEFDYYWRYLDSRRHTFPGITGAFCGYGVGTSDFKNPQIEWKGADTYIQKDGINHDFGVFDDPDSFYTKHGSNLRGLKEVLYKHLVRKLMNMNISRIRHTKGDL